MRVGAIMAALPLGAWLLGHALLMVDADPAQLTAQFLYLFSYIGGAFILGMAGLILALAGVSALLSVIARALGQAMARR